MADFIVGRYDETGESWSDHVCMWARGKCERKIILRYEDLVADTAGEIRKVLEFLDWDLDGASIAAAIEAASFQNLRRLEEKHGWMQEARTESGKGTPFFRKGKVNDWQNTFSAEDLSAFWKRHEAGMRIFEYR